ncbi:MAG: mechanosensitive ion channel [Candidatus Cloacimonetes bacterium]|nr:mechanosensitive ion channel [Candidatus Cloacimonadota bacterium]
MRLRLLVISLLFIASAILAAQSTPVFALAEQDSTITKAPVVYKNKVVFYIYSSLGSFSPFERAAIVSKRLEELGLQKVLFRDSLNILESESEFTIRYAEKPIFTISNADSLVLQRPIKDIAVAYHEAIATEFIPRFMHMNLRQNLIMIARTVFLALLVIFIAGFLFRMLRKLVLFLNSLKDIVAQRNPDGFTFKGIRFLSTEQFTKVADTLIGFIRFALIVLLSYFTLYFLLLVIPPTRHIALQLQAYIMNPLMDVGNAILDYLPNLFFIAVVLIVTKYILQFLRYLFDEIENGHIHFQGFYPDWADSTYQIVKFLILFFVVVIIFPYLPGSGSPAFQGISIFVGVLFSLGSSSAIANIIAGIILTYMRAYRVGDYVHIGDKQGILMETTLLVVRIKTLKNEEVSIPNAIVLGGNITNFSSYAREGNLLLHTKITIGYDVPWQTVSELLVSAALRSHGINKNKPPFVNVSSLMDHYVEYELNTYSDSPNSMPSTYSELHRHILDTFAEAGIEIMSPMYNAVRDGNQSTIPPSQTGLKSENQ